MKSRKGFTLIELMVVVLIVAVLAAVLIPMLTARLEAAKWSEGKAGAGTIATAVRAMAAEYGQDTGGPALPTPVSGTVQPYMTVSDLKGKWFDNSCYSFSVVPTLNAAGSLYPANFCIHVAAPGGGSSTWTEKNWYLDETGTWGTSSMP